MTWLLMSVAMETGLANGLQKPLDAAYKQGHVDLDL
jgi:hypothetical protein